MNDDRETTIRFRDATLAAQAMAALGTEAAQLRAERDTLRREIVCIRDNALAWHGPMIGTGHERSLAVIARWCDAALAPAPEQAKERA